ncbi:MAG: hypothetical protein IPI28_19415 [Candidatus Omnitrophica bacterium]|nr:hypothetical protein [Candidatus Omnitrophota bacterium]
MFVERLLETTVSGLIPARRIDSLNLLNPSEQQVSDLKRFLRSASTKPLLIAIAELASQRHLWINELKIERLGIHPTHCACPVEDKCRQDCQMVGLNRRRRFSRATRSHTETHCINRGSLPET